MCESVAGHSFERGGKRASAIGLPRSTSAARSHVRFTGSRKRRSYRMKQPVSLTSAAARLALGITCDHLAIMSISFFVWKGEHSHGNIRWAIIPKSWKAYPYFIWGRSRNEISMVNSAIAFDEQNPGACIALKFTELAQVERVPNLTCDRGRRRQPIPSRSAICCYLVSIRHASITRGESMAVRMSRST